MKSSNDNLLNRYLQAVGFWLPRRQKEDIRAELSEDLRSQIEDREESLGRSLSDAEIAAILKQRGRPMFVAGGFMPQRSLIGPALYPIYVFVLKIVTLCYLVPWFLTWLGLTIFEGAQSRIHIHTPISSLGTLWTIAFTQFGVITLIFAVLERVSVRSQLVCDWDPGKLPKVHLPQTAKRRANALAGVIFGFLGLIWLLALPTFPFLILGPTAFELNAAPIWETVYAWIIALAVAGIAENAVTLLAPQVTWFRPVFRLGTSALSLWIAYRLLQTHTYIQAASAHAVQYAAITNLVVQICVAGTAFGLAIGLIFNAWEAFREISRSMHSTAAHPA